MVHLSGGAISGIAFGTALFVFVSVSLALWYRRVYRDHYSSDPNAWGGSWGVKAQQELQARINRQHQEEWRAKEAAGQAAWEDIEMQSAQQKSLEEEGKVVKENTTEHSGTAVPVGVKGQSSL